MGGQKIYVITSPQDVSRAYKSKSLSFNGFTEPFFVSFGIPPAISHMIHQAPKHEHIDGKPAGLQRKSKMHWTEDAYREQLLPGEKFDILGKRVTEMIQDALQWKRLCKTFSRDPSANAIDIPLLSLCKKALIDTATAAVFGEQLLQIDPHMTESFCQFDNNSYMLMLKYPSIFAQAMYAPKQDCIDAMTQYFSLPKAERKEAAWMVKSEEEGYSRDGINQVEIGKLITMMFWV